LSEACRRSGATLGLGLALALAVGAAGCADLRFRRGPFLEADASALVPGETRLRDVLERLGPPDKLSRTGAGFSFLYERFDARERQVGVAVPFVEALKLVLGRVTVRHQTLLLEFGADGGLLARRLEDRSGRVGSGGAVQLMVVVAPLAELSPFTERAPQHRWGAALLRPLPQELNRAQDLDSGARGLEQRATPRKAGQRTLEAHKPEAPL
jgi:hypothetical protein